MTSVPQAALSEAETALAAALGAEAVITATAELDEYTADTYWPALAAKAAGEPIARPDVVVRPRTEEDVATVLAVADAQRVPVVPWGGGSGTQGGALATHGGIVDRPALARPGARDRRDLADRHRAGRQERPGARGRAQRPRADAPALPRLGRVGDGRRLHRGARLRRALHALRQDRGPAAVAARGHAGRRPRRHAAGAAARDGPGADAAVRRLGGHARRDHARHAAARAAAGDAPLRRGRVRGRAVRA